MINIKKRWFRNWYIVEYDNGYKVEYWNVASQHVSVGGIYGPYFHFTALNKVKRLNGNTLSYSHYC